LADTFPRTTALPTQSPLHWVRQKDRYLRQLMIRDIESVTKRRLVVYFANREQGGAVDINYQDMPYMAELFEDVAPEEPVDLMLETTGGFTDATEAVVSFLKCNVKDLRVIVPNAAKSNGTLLALVSSSIVMGATSELGPIDPHISGTPCNILIDPAVAAQNVALAKLAENAIKQTQALATSVLSDGMMKEAGQDTINKTVELLSTNNHYFSHGSVIDHNEAVGLGLKVEYLPPTDELWRRIWLLYCMYAHDARRDKLLKIFEGRSRSTATAAA